MGCGCKGKSQGTTNGGQAQGAVGSNTNTNTQQIQSASIQENIRKVVEKYYKKK